MSTIISAPAKINLRLKVEGRRKDGYHLLSMLNIKVGLFDELAIAHGHESTTIQTSCTGDAALDAALSDPARNIAARAVNVFNETFGLTERCRIDLTKQIPSGAGMGGGSSDAGAIIRYLAERHFPEKYGACGPQGGQFRSKLVRMALSLGADVPYFLYEGLSLLKGVGEIVTELPDAFLAGKKILIIKPGFSIPTAALFKEYRRQTEGQRFAMDTVSVPLLKRQFSGRPDDAWRTIYNLIENDLQPVVIGIEPRLGALMELCSRNVHQKCCLTGSGSAFFVVAEDGEPSLDNDIIERLKGEGCLVYQVPVVCRLGN